MERQNDWSERERQTATERMRGSGENGELRKVAEREREMKIRGRRNENSLSG